MSTVDRSTFDEVMTPSYNPSSVIPVRGAGARVWDQAGREYVDFAGGIAVNCLGHCHPDLVRVLHEQGQRLWHLSNVYTNEPALELGRRLTELTFAEKVFFCNSGGEANEAALKLARRYAVDHFGREKDQIIAFNKAFHGRTFFTVTVGGQPAYSDGFGPKPGGIDHVDYNDLAQLEALISDRTCAVMMEPLQGEGGIVPAEPEFVRGVRALCDKHNALLIFDEVQTGVGRTGSLYAYQSLGVVPDILTTAKALGGGFPIGAMLTTSAIGASLVMGTHGSTYGGNPLACAVANKVLEIVATPEFLAGVQEKGAMIRAELEAMGQRHGVFSGVRGQGLLLGAQMSEPFAGQAREVLGAGVAEGVMCLVAGPDVLRLAPALNIADADITEGLKRLDSAVAQVAASRSAA